MRFRGSYLQSQVKSLPSSNDDLPDNDGGGGGPGGVLRSLVTGRCE